MGHVDVGLNLHTDVHATLDIGLGGVGWGMLHVGLTVASDVHATLWLSWGRVGWGGVGQC